MPAFYNEIDPFPARWLRNLMDLDLIPEGHVDERSIKDLGLEDTAPISHFFAGIGGWPYALRLAGWPDDQPVWTGSCPCQPFSTAGRGEGFEDPRHLWPAWFHLIRKRQPPVIFGEQVANPLGLAWLDLVSSDLEGAGYTFGAADLCAASIGAPHIRQRFFFVAIADEQRREGISLQLRSRGSRSAVAEARRSRETIRAGNTSRTRREGRSLPARGRDSERSPWSPSGAVWCRDGKWRHVEPGAFPLAHGISSRVGRLRAYGNAIVPQLAAVFIQAACEAMND
jgi:DNA (cytosine-5)-methyltransferase 1